MTTKPVLPANEQEARKAIEASLAGLRRSIADYRRVTGGYPPDFMTGRPARNIPFRALGKCRVFPNRNVMLEKLLPAGGRVAELGTWSGDWASVILEEKRPDELHLLDVTFDKLDAGVRADPRISLHLGDSSTNLAKFPDGYFDWIYIDGDHSYEGVVRDARVARQKICHDGILVFNDYTHWSALQAMPYGVVSCVNDMLGGKEWRMIGLALTSNGYYDVALQRFPAETAPAAPTSA